MPRLSRGQIMERNAEIIKQYFEQENKAIFTLNDLKHILEELKTAGAILKTTSLYEFVDFLDTMKFVSDVIIDLPYRTTHRFVYGEVTSWFVLALGLRRRSYLSHYSALYYHSLTNNVTKKIYTNVEQSKKYQHSYQQQDPLEQRNIDLAFSRPMRETNQIAKMHMVAEKEGIQVYLLNGKHLGRLGVVEMELFDGYGIPITNMERTLIDIVVRPNYSGGVYEVLYAFEQAKGRFSVNRLLAMLKQMDFTYPYYQLIGFYMEKAGYPESVLSLFKQFDINYNMYLTYEMKDKDYSSRWCVYYPKGF